MRLSIDYLERGRSVAVDHLEMPLGRAREMAEQAIADNVAESITIANEAGTIIWRRPRVLRPARS